MPRADVAADLWSSLSAAGDPAERALWGADTGVTLAALEGGSALGGRRRELEGRTVLLATHSQLTASLALIELDGVVRRIVLCPPDLPAAHLPFVATTAGAEAIVVDRPEAPSGGVAPVVTCRPEITAAEGPRRSQYETEWILLTSGTTGRPKMVVHTLASLAGAIRGRPADAGAVWSTFYDIRRYGGLQILLRALLGGGSMVLSSADEAIGDFLARAGARGVTHISGTPSHWRRALMSPAVRRMAPRYVRLSGEIADQAVLDHLRAAYPAAAVAHAFASTEAGVAFDVGDGLAGFPASLLGPRPGGVELKIEDGSLRIRSARTATRYLGVDDGPLADRDGFVDTGDMIEQRGERCYFIGRKGGIINVGGLKVHPEEVEAVINDHPRVRMSLVRTRKSPITGALVVADVVLTSDPVDADVTALQDEILRRCRDALPRHKVPATINVVPALAVAASGKLVRRYA